MRLKLLFAVAFFVALIVAGKVSAQVAIPGPLIKSESMMGDYNQQFLEKLIDTAKKYYPQARIRAMQTKTANTTLGKTKASWLDGVSISPSYVFNPSAASTVNPDGSTTRFVNGYQLAVNLSLTSFVTHGYDVRNAKQAVKVAELSEDEYKQTLTGQVSRYYIAYIGAQANLRTAKKAVNDALINLNAVTHRFEAAETTLTEYNAILAAAAAQNTAQVTAEMAVLTAKVNLEEFVGKRLEDIK